MPPKKTAPATKTVVKPYVPPADTTIYVKAIFSPGDVKHLDYDKCHIRFNKTDSIISRLCTHYSITMHVEYKRTDGYTILWHFDKIIPGAGFDRQSPFRNAIEKMMEGVEVEVMIDTAGAYVQTDNWFVTKNQLTHKIDSMKSVFKNDTTAQKYIKKLYAIVNTKDIIEPLVVEQATLYFSVYGKYINQKQGAHTSCGMVDIFGGDPFEAYGQITIDTLNRKAKTMSLSWHQGVDKKEAHDIVKKALNLQARINNRPLPTDADIPQVDVYEDYKLSFNFRTTWFTHITYSKVTTNGKAGEHDTIDMVLH